jgi:hypothetical protein
MFFIKPIPKNEITSGDYFIIEQTMHGERYYQTDSSWNIREHYVNQWIPIFKEIVISNKNLSFYLILPDREIVPSMNYFIKKPSMHVILCK